MSAKEFDSLFQSYGAFYDVDWKLLKAQARAESNFDCNAESPAGACGLTQFMPATFKEWSKKLKLENPDPFNPWHSVACQAAYMQWLIEQFDGDVTQALAAYNFGIGNVKKGKEWPKETKDYVTKVTKWWKGS
jgi:soluble lytic murein transglycosylase-like protein